MTAIFIIFSKKIFILNSLIKSSQKKNVFLWDIDNNNCDMLGDLGENFPYNSLRYKNIDEGSGGKKHCIHCLKFD